MNGASIMWQLHLDFRSAAMSAMWHNDDASKQQMERCAAIVVEMWGKPPLLPPEIEYCSLIIKDNNQNIICARQWHFDHLLKEDGKILDSLTLKPLKALMKKDWLWVEYYTVWNWVNWKTFLLMSNVEAVREIHEICLDNNYVRYVFVDPSKPFDENISDEDRFLMCNTAINHIKPFNLDNEKHLRFAKWCIQKAKEDEEKWQSLKS